MAKENIKWLWRVNFGGELPIFCYWFGSFDSLASSLILEYFAAEEGTQELIST